MLTFSFLFFFTEENNQCVIHKSFVLIYNLNTFLSFFLSLLFSTPRYISISLSPFSLHLLSLSSLLLRPEIQLAFKILPSFAANKLNSYFHIVIMLKGTGTIGQAGFCFTKGPVVTGETHSTVLPQHRTFFEDQLIPFFHFYCHPQDSFKV